MSVRNLRTWAVIAALVILQAPVMFAGNGGPRQRRARVDRQIGLEPTPDEFVAALVAVFREVRRVLRDDGTVWLNLGDSYNAGTSAARRKS